MMVHEGGLLGIYVRSFGETVQATPEQIREMVLMSDNTPYDRPFVDAHFRQEDFQKLFAHAKEQGENVTEKQLMSIGFLSGEGCLSKGALLFADACSDLRTKAVATAWPGITKGSSYVTASETFVGNLLDVIAACIAFVRNHSNNGFEKQANPAEGAFGDIRDRRIAQPVHQPFVHSQGKAGRDQPGNHVQPEHHPESGTGHIGADLLQEQALRQHPVPGSSDDHGLQPVRRVVAGEYRNPLGQQAGQVHDQHDQQRGLPVPFQRIPGLGLKKTGWVIHESSCKRLAFVRIFACFPRSFSASTLRISYHFELPETI